MQKSFADEAVVTSYGRSTPSIPNHLLEEPAVLLRVRRRGAIFFCSILRVELDAALAAASALSDVDLDDNDDVFHRRSSTSTTSTAVFRRIEPLSKEEHRLFSNGSSGHRSSSLKRRLVLDAVLLEEHRVDEDPPKNEKRRRVTLQLLEPKKEPPTAPSYTVLTPEQRAVDDSLHRVFEGTLSLEKHLQFLESATRISQNVTRDDDGLPSQLWPWRHSVDGLGNCLHAAAIWNEAHSAKYLFGRFLTRLALTQKHSFLNELLLLSVNAEGLNPIEVARLSGNAEVQQVFEMYASSLPDGLSTSPLDTSDIRYDLYSLVPESRNLHESKVEDVDPVVLDCELHNECLGFWDATTGDLVLAPNRSIDKPDDDLDSNDEDWDGNDYPDDDDWSCSSSEEQENGNFRHRQAASRYAARDYDDDNSDNYDPSFGAIYGQNESLYDDHC
jgi:Transcription factor Iwr1